MAGEETLDEDELEESFRALRDQERQDVSGEPPFGPKHGDGRAAQPQPAAAVPVPGATAPRSATPPQSVAPPSHSSRPEVQTGLLYGPVVPAGPAGAAVQPVVESDLAAVERLAAAYRRITAELRKVIVGQERVIEELLIAMLAGGHCLLVGVPGLAKTLMVRMLADTLDLSFNRIQFTPDLMPADITGTEVIQEDRASGVRAFRFLEGPVFAHVVLADEINRTPPKTQAALLEAMQEHQVTAGGKRHLLPDPFFVLATQNPIEQEGTYPLPEAQLDRFMFEVLVDYPSEDEEFEIVRQTTAETQATVQKILSRQEVKSLQAIVRKVPVADHVIRYAMQFARLTRRDKGDVPDFIREFVSWGAGPRASQYLILGAKARAVLNGRTYASTDDVRAVAAPVLRHRIITNFNAEAEGVKPDQIVERLMQTIETPHESRGSAFGAKLPRMFKTAEHPNHARG